jgi:hypothetical protein
LHWLLLIGLEEFDFNSAGLDCADMSVVISRLEKHARFVKVWRQVALMMSATRSEL